MNASIIRVEQGVEGTFGVLLLEGQSFCVTMELPWINNADDISCIPDGTYICKRYNSPKHKKIVWELQDVPDRDHVQLHAGCELKNTLGCILVGQYFDKLRDNRAVLNSGATFTKLMQVTRNEKRLVLTIDTHYEKKTLQSVLNVL